MIPGATDQAIIGAKPIRTPATSTRKRSTKSASRRSLLFRRGVVGFFLSPEFPRGGRGGSRSSLLPVRFAIQPPCVFENCTREAKGAVSEEVMEVMEVMEVIEVMAVR